MIKNPLEDSYSIVASSQNHERISVGKQGGCVNDDTSGCHSWNGALLPTGRGNITSARMSNHNRVHLISWARLISSSWPSTSLWLPLYPHNHPTKRAATLLCQTGQAPRALPPPARTKGRELGRGTCWYKGSKGKQRERDVKPDPSNNIKTDSDFPLYLVGQMIL